MQTVLIVFHVLVAAGLITLILLQRGAGATAGAAFGAGASGTVFGARGAANFLTRTTAVLAIGFFVISLALAVLASRNVPQQVDTGLAIDPPAEETVEESVPAEETAQAFPEIPADETAPDDDAADPDVEAAEPVEQSDAEEPVPDEPVAGEE